MYPWPLEPTYPLNPITTLAKTTCAMPNPAMCRVLERDRCGREDHAQEPNGTVTEGAASTDSSAGFARDPRAERSGVQQPSTATTLLYNTFDFVQLRPRPR
jgi:hypothetical protein